MNESIEPSANEKLNDFSADRPRLQGLKSFLLRNGCKMPSSLPLLSQQRLNLSEDSILRSEIRLLQTQLKDITCQLNLLSPVEFQALCDALSSCSEFYLRLEYTNLGALDTSRFKTFCTALSQSVRLRGLSLKGRGLDKLDNDCFNAFCKALSLSCSAALETLILNGKDFETLSPTRFGVFLNAFSQSRELQTLNLETNDLDKLTPHHFQGLRTAFSHWGQLKSLNLNDNYLGRLPPGHFQILFEGVSYCTELQEFHFAWNHLNQLLDKVCSETFYSWLLKCSKLQVLDLSSNWLNVTHLQALYKILPQCIELRSLNLHNLDFVSVETNSPFQALKEVILQCETLIDLKISKQFSPQEHAMLTDIMIEHSRFIQGIQTTLDNALRLPEIPANLQDLIIEYTLAPHNALAERNKRLLPKRSLETTSFAPLPSFINTGNPAGASSDEITQKKMRKT